MKARRGHGAVLRRAPPTALERTLFPWSGEREKRDDVSRTSPDGRVVLRQYNRGSRSDSPCLGGQSLFRQTDVDLVGWRIERIPRVSRSERTRPVGRRLPWKAPPGSTCIYPCLPRLEESAAAATRSAGAPPHVALSRRRTGPHQARALRHATMNLSHHLGLSGRRRQPWAERCVLRLGEDSGPRRPVDGRELCTLQP